MEECCNVRLPGQSSPKKAELCGRGACEDVRVSALLCVNPARAGRTGDGAVSAQSLAMPFSRGRRLLGYPQDGRSRWAAAVPSHVPCRAVPCRLPLTTRRGDAGCEAGAGWKGASCNQEMYCGCWAACAMQHLGDKAQKSARLSGDAGGDLGEGDAGGRRLAGDGERAKGERA